MAIKTELVKNNEIQERILSSLTSVTEQLAQLNTKMEKSNAAPGTSDRKWMQELQNHLTKWSRLCCNAIKNEGRAQILQDFLERTPPFIPRRCREWTDPRNQDSESWKRLKDEKEAANVRHEIQKMSFYAEDQRRRMKEIEEKVEHSFLNTSLETQDQINQQWRKDCEMEQNMHILDFDKKKLWLIQAPDREDQEEQVNEDQISELTTFPGGSAGVGFSKGASFFQNSNPNFKTRGTFSRNPRHRGPPSHRPPPRHQSPRRPSPRRSSPRRPSPPRQSAWTTVTSRNNRGHGNRGKPRGGRQPEVTFYEEDFHNPRKPWHHL